MSGDTNLSGKKNTIAYVSRSCQADLSTQQSIFAYLAAVAHLDKIVNLRAWTDSCFANAGAVNAGVRLDLNAVTKDGEAGLNDLLPMIALVFGEAKPVSSDDNSVLQDDIVPELAVLANHGVRVREEITADARTAIDNDVRKNDAVIADDYVFIDHDKRSYGSSRTNSCGWMNLCGGMNARCIFRWLIKERESACERQVWIRAA